MTTQEFKDYCDEEFTKRGFVKKKLNLYYLNTDKDILVSIYLQRSSYGGAYYINYDFYIGTYDDIKRYPTYYESDMGSRMRVLSKQTINGERFMGALIEYERYTLDEIKPYIEAEFEKYIMPVLTRGKQHLIDNIDHIAPGHNKTKEHILEKLNS